MRTLRVASYNTLNYGVAPRRAGERERWDRVAQVIGEVDADVWALQEIAHQDALVDLAKAIGLQCMLPAPARDESSPIAFDPGNNALGVGLLWKPEITPVRETLRAYSGSGGGVFFHGLVKAEFEVDGVRFLAASTHLTPFGRHRRADEAERAVSALTRTGGGTPAILGSDSNSVSGDRVLHEGRWTHHAPDRYQGDWYDDLVHQCDVVYDEHGERRWSADRAPGERLFHGGLLDTGAVLDAPVLSTVGYWPTGDPFGERDIDHVRCTADLAAALRAVSVHRSDTTEIASDHRPKIAEFDLAALADRTGR